MPVLNVRVLMVAGGLLLAGELGAQPVTMGRVFPVMGVHAEYPIGVSGSFGIGVALQRIHKSFLGSENTFTRHVFFAAEPGTRGGMLSIGAGSFGARLMGTVRISELHMWSGNGTTTAPGNDYTGAELTFPCLLFSIRSGVFVRSDESKIGSKILVPLGVTVGW
jgi:hypothetical protein